MNVPVATERKSFLPLRLRTNTLVESTSIPIISRQTTAVTTSMPLAIHNDAKSSFTVGDRVLINGVKRGTLRYKGAVKFAQGVFCGIELDEPDGKHDGQVNNIRYFQCKTNYGIFVPHDKVVLAPRELTCPSPRTISRLRPPAKMTRSFTLPSSMDNQIQPTQIKTSQTSAHLPDIIPNSPISIQSIPKIETIKESIVSDDHDIIKPTSETKTLIEPPSEIKTSIEPPSLTTDEPLETIETDFIDSVSLILQQLQQEQKIFSIPLCTSITNSEEGAIYYDDDDDDDEIDELDNESIADSVMSEQKQSIHRLSSTIDSTKSIQTDLSFDINDNITFIKNNLSNSNKPSINSTRSINKSKINPQDNKVNINMKRPSIPTSVPEVKKSFERKSSVPLANSLSSLSKSSLMSSRQRLVSTNLLKSATLSGSQSKLNQLYSRSNSLASSQSDLTSNQPNKSKIPSKSTPKKIQGKSPSVDLSLDKKSNNSRHSLDSSDNKLIIQKIICQSSEVTNQRLKNQYQQLLNHFDLMHILSQYYITENEQIKQQYELKLSKIRIAYNQLKISIEQLQSSFKNELAILNEQHQNQINIMKETSKEKFIEYQQQIDKLLNEKIKLESHCTSLQEQVDRFMEEMANSEHADPLLRRVEILEKDRTSLQTALEIKNQELTQLRTKFNEQVFQREDQLALQKRIDMVENRNQDLVCLLRGWQLNEKAVVVERDQLKEQLAQLERDKQQLTFENETLIYSLRQRSSSISFTQTSKSNFNSCSTQKLRNRAHSFSSIITTNTRQNRHLTRSLSLNCILNR
ncbi:unnamed protein product [Rotaria sordida]|uniref:CAP-Gly domain-containing protein n=1 Tax=Rotaria sordida TaxID=392033 RepID=A0A818WU19_9BILA|nr:unnamed protein product [Rotaria sordida]CAF3730346.1 unnamed protein product [Rotaria sordida]